jgi:CheY-like chemotaxis protein
VSQVADRIRPLILVADDELNILRLIAFLLRAADFDVLTAEDGEEALALAVGSRPDVAVLDFSMPKLTGSEVMEALRAHESTSTMPVIFVSAYDLDEVAPDLESNPQHFIRKPFRSKELVGAVQQCLQNGHGPGKQDH